MNGLLGFGHRPKWIARLLGLSVVAVILFLRRPDFLLDAKLWAEDGTIWYAEAAAKGFASAFSPQNGYFQTISRIVFWVAQAIPIETVPLFANTVGLLIRVAPVAFICSSRFDWIPWQAKLAMVAYYVLMPGIEEVHANITNAHWYLAIYVLMIVISRPPRSSAGRVHDFVALTIAGLSGPFILLLLPCFALRLLCDRSHRGYVLRLTVLATLLAAVQVLAIVLTGGETRSPAPLGASFGLLLQIIGVRIVSGTFLARGAPGVAANAVLVALALGIGVAAIRAGGWRAACVSLLAVLQISAALASPMISLDQPQWPLFLVGGERYFVIPRLLLVALVVFAVAGLRPKLVPGALLIAVLVLALLPGFHLRPVPGPPFAAEAGAYRRAVVGQVVVMRIAPPPWTMAIIRR